MLGVVAFSLAGTAGVASAQPAALVIDRSDDADVSACTDAANDCTLRGALGRAVNGEIIVFDDTVFPANPATPVEILVGSPLPAISAGNVTLVGPDSSSPVVVLDGSFAGVGVNGLVIDSSDNFVRGIAIRNFDGDGVEVAGGDWNRLGGDGGCDQPARQNVYTDNGGYGVHIATGELNFVWTSDIGRLGEGNAAGGVLIDGDAAFTRLVGDCVRIVGNGGPGVHVQGSSAVELGANGIVYTQSNAGPGVWLEGAGGTDNFFGDLRSTGNDSHGVLVTDGATRFSILGQITGNGGDGIHVDGGSFISFNSGSLSDNDGAGLRVIDGSSVRVVNNSITISGNGGLGIDLGPLGVTPNDVGDADSGPNDLLNYPEITSVVGAGPNQADVSGTACAGCTVWIYRVIADPSGHGEGSAMSSGTADGSGNFTVRVNGLAIGEPVTAIALAGGWSTSEFAANAEGLRGPLVVDRADDADVRTCSDAANDCTLRGALNEVAQGGTIHFDATVFPTPSDPSDATQIVPSSPLPSVTQSYVVIEGSTGSVPRVIIDGSSAGAGVSGLVLESDWNRVRGLFIRNFDGDGIRVASGTLNWLGSESCFSAGPNILTGNGGAGARVMGGTGGVNFRGMYVGVLPDGTAAGNGEAGIVIEDGGDFARGNNTCMRIAYNQGPGVQVGAAQDVYFQPESSPGQMLIDHNSGAGVVFDGSVAGAIIGARIVDNDGDGVSVVGGADQVVITSNSEIQRNGGAGVRVVDGQKVLLGSVRIFGNAGLAFDLVAPGDGPDGVTPNDEGDLDDGPNGLLNRPIITSVEGAGDNVRVQGTACAGCRVEFYEVEADPSGYGGLDGSIGFVIADGTGAFDGTIPLPDGASFTALATQATYVMSEPSLNVRGPGKIIVDRADDALVDACTGAANDCTLRGALAIAPNGGEIAFDRDVFPDVDSASDAGATVIALSGPLPVVTVERLTIEGSDAGNGAPVVIDGAGAGAVDGLVLDGTEARISGLHFTNFAGNGVVVRGTFNFLGKFDGCGGANVTITNVEGYGVHVDGANQTIIGAVRSGLTGSGNTAGGMLVDAGANQTLLNGCYQATGNGGAGLHIVGATTHEVYSQGDVTLTDNLDGMLVDGAHTVTVLGDYVDNRRDGIRVIGGAYDVRVVQSDVISNDEVGVHVIDGQDVWVAENARVRDNGKLGIDLVGPDDDAFGVTPNDPDDGDFGPNGLQNFPVLRAIRSIGDGRFLLEGTSCAGCVVVAYHQAPDPSGYGEADSYINKATADAGGVFSIQADLGLDLSGLALTFTASRGFSTSEFSSGLLAEPLSEVEAVCGNGSEEAGEECDDGNTNSGDGCSGACSLEVCGDGVVQNYAGHVEVCDGPCDDGDACTVGDSCTSDCGACQPGLNVCPCDTANGGCEQVCVDDGGGRFHCECDTGFVLAPDGQSCFAETTCSGVSCDGTQVFYGVVTNPDGTVAGSIRCERAADGEVTCLTDEDGFLAVQEVLWCE